MSAGNAVFSIFSFLTLVLASIPLFWHIEAWNAGMCLYIVWTALGNLLYFVNSVIWEGNTVNWASVWCDISTKFMVGLTIGLPAASLCINRRLYKIANIRKVVIAKAEKRRDVMIDLCIGVGAPFVVMALQYISQSHRFDIFEDIGCMPNNQNTWVALLVTQVPIIIITVISGAYSIASAIAFKRREIELRILLSSTSAPSPNRYLRLMCLAGINVVLTCFIVAASIIYSVNFGFQPWVSWDNIHFSFSQIDQQPATIWRSDPNRLTMLELPRWIVVINGLLFFAFFGFASEARKNYSKAYMAIIRCLCFRKFEKSNVKDSDAYVTFNCLSNICQY
ncbi:pheromone receptor [Collybia nuda]|uniref:Pheromone receptor n=1 Tax=Collybia nuda TaxID=64659 RepID=A0A9P5YG53_9AGAR|nr:pheromone receptor [Collybia nuda]